MIQSVTFCEFCDTFRDGNRNNQFSYDGKKALYEYLEQYEEDTGEQVEFDMIALCCEYTEYEDLKEFQSDYGNEYESLEDIRDHTQVIEIENSDGFIIQQF